MTNRTYEQILETGEISTTSSCDIKEFLVSNGLESEMLELTKDMEDVKNGI